MKRGLYGSATIVLSSIVALLGLAMIGVALAGGGGPLARGVLVGALFVLAGAGRVWMALRVQGLGGPDDADRREDDDG